VIAAYSTHRIDSVSAALGIHLIVYCAIGAGLAFGLYALLQPSRTPNSGLPNRIGKWPCQSALSVKSKMVPNGALGA
jgi:hypothetical protein